MTQSIFLLQVPYSRLFIPNINLFHFYPSIIIHTHFHTLMIHIQFQQLFTTELLRTVCSSSSATVVFLLFLSLCLSDYFPLYLLLANPLMNILHVMSTHFKLHAWHLMLHTVIMWNILMSTHPLCLHAASSLWYEQMCVETLCWGQW